MDNFSFSHNCFLNFVDYLYSSYVYMWEMAMEYLYSSFHLYVYMWERALDYLYSSFHLYVYMWERALDYLYSSFHRKVYMWERAMDYLYSSFHMCICRRGLWTFYILHVTSFHRYACTIFTLLFRTFKA